MRTGGLVSDFTGEDRCEELRSVQAGVSGLRFDWQGGGTFCGSPTGLPPGRDPGISFQVYVGRQFAGYTGGNGFTTQVLPSRQNWVEIIPIASHLREIDQHHVCENTGGETAELYWPKSTSDDVQTYRIYENDGAGGAVSYTTPTATVQARPGGEYPATGYTYRTARHASGTWVFGIRAVDAAGNVQTTPTREQSCTITRVPEPPGSLAYTYAFATKKATLTWTSPTNWT